MTVGDIARQARRADEDMMAQTLGEVAKELGNLVLSAVRWCDDLGIEPESAVTLAAAAQRAYAARLRAERLING